MPFSRIVIIYNPNSTGPSEQKARKLAAELKTRLKNVPISCVATEHAGHAETLAYDYAQQEKRPLIVSSSGDGGYHEVVNGVIKAANPQAVCAVLPAGNANDHSRTMQSRPLADAIVAAKVTHIDVLQVAIAGLNQQTMRFAHSYGGLGLTPVVAVELNRHSLNSLKEIYIVVRTFFKYRPFQIRHAGSVRSFDSLVFANINQMAKVLTFAPKNRPADGKFELVAFPAGRKFGLVRRLAKAAVSNVDHVERLDEYAFSTLKQMPLQLDGEVMTLEAGSVVTVSVRRHGLATVV